MIFYSLIGICVLFGLGVLISSLRYQDGLWMSIGAGLFMMLLAGLISTIVFLIVAGIFIPSNHTTKYERPLEALANNTGASGSFFLGSGSVGSDSYLTYIVKGSDGSYKIETVNADYYKIFQDSASGGTLVTYGAALDSWWVAPFSISRSTSIPVELHIPEGSIQTGYNIDVNK